MQVLNLKDEIRNQPTKPVSDSKAIHLGQIKLYLIASAGLSFISLFLLLVNIGYTQRITAKAFPTLVQMNDGSTIEIGFKDPNYRSPEVIEAFVSETLYYLMTMTSYDMGDARVSSLDPNRKKGMPVSVKVGDGQGAITQSAWLAAESLESNFADKFRSKLAQMTPPDIFDGREEVILKFDYVKQPVEVTNANGEWAGQWHVDIIANLKVFRLGAGEVKTIPFNKRVTVRPIDTVAIHDVEQFGALATALNASQRSGLQITDIKDLKVTEVF